MQGMPVLDANQTIFAINKIHYHEIP